MGLITNKKKSKIIKVLLFSIIHKKISLKIFEKNFMGGNKEFMLMKQEAKSNNDYSLVDAFKINLNWKKNYNKKSMTN
ncbi:hypothetical protein [Metamycoplasma hominis]|uniref:Uncharacterized protein n=1 Tax=Metamycoplasma hominis TaxID=2098 RepID=A0A454C9H9_METHO|nr:hypothetical protein [Metamycoplasma hominis]AYN65372.1 hypothetical protein KN71_001495 [Metamycoplasma hominis]QKX39953.1 hypothetical protein HU159_01295 [Metamycoplasma hominis]